MVFTCDFNINSRIFYVLGDIMKLITAIIVILGSILMWYDFWRQLGA